ncbi:adenylylsulfatase HINT3 isoform X2 [Magnolia sinica]|uniref:adenylylsulfatase HINT3 isoform X2 n=1 Tax=Magnolia sinica TaxID=86752 RepID=UPI0026580E80|nr:adenylylsulfatase HINT3 isoform X2 [Magnolia sinica]
MALRRLSILCSHLHPINSDCPSPNNERSRSNGLSCVSLSNCDSGSENCQMDESEKGNEGNGCVFCMIIRGESPAFKALSDYSKIPFFILGCNSSFYSFNLLVNNGADAGQVIFHTHLHIIPRKAQDRLWTSKGFRRKPLKLNQDTIQLADCIREGLSLQVNHCDGFEGQRSKLPENS